MRFRFWVLIAGGLFVIDIVAGVVVAAAMPEDITSLFSEQAAA